VGTLPFREIVFAHCVVLLPASAIVGNEKDSIVMSENPVEQTPSVIVHLNTLEPMLKLLTFVVGLELREIFSYGSPFNELNYSRIISSLLFPVKFSLMS
jgi:hypothetical protein